MNVNLSSAIMSVLVFSPVIAFAITPYKNMKPNPPGMIHTVLEIQEPGKEAKTAKLERCLNEKAIKEVNERELEAQKHCTIKISKDTATEAISETTCNFNGKETIQIMTSKYITPTKLVSTIAVMPAGTKIFSTQTHMGPCK